MNELSKQGEFDQWSDSYDDDTAQDGCFPFDGYERVLTGVISAAALEPGQTILELGIGTGNLTRRLVDLGFRVWGLDFSSSMLAIARQKAPEATLAQADLLGDFPSDFKRPYDRVLATYVFHEFPTDAKVNLLQKLFDNYLAPAGYIVIGDIGFPNAAAREAMRESAGELWDEEYYWIADEILSTLLALGIEVEYFQVSSCGLILVFHRVGRLQNQ